MVTLIKLSGSTNGKRILIASGSPSATTVHTAQAGTGYYDQIFVYCYSNHTANLDLTILYGSGSVADTIIQTIPPKQGRYLILDGTLLNNGLSVTAYTTVANVMTLDGYVFSHSA